MTDYDMSIHTNPDARAWAAFFIKTFPNSTVDEETMATWFANAMMAMHDSMRPDLAPVVLPDGSAFVIGEVG
jgi:hypothetical protein